MKRRQLQALSVYVRELADRLELRDWTLKLIADPIGDDEAIARICPTYGRKAAVIEFQHGFEHLDAHKVRLTVAHELIHLHVNPIMHCHQHGAVEVMIGKPAYEILDQDVIEKVEYAVDALADAVAPHLPLIDWEHVPKWARQSRKGVDIVVQPYRAALQEIIDAQG